MALVLSISASKLLELGTIVLQFFPSIPTLRDFLLPAVASHDDPLEGEARGCELGSGPPCVGWLSSVLLCNDDGDVVSVVVSLQRAKDDSFPAFFSCVQATLGV